jgi:heme/copper-type cytochrome/quinol oxidase subunit 2
MNTFTQETEMIPMYDQEKKTVASLLASLIVLIAYVLYGYARIRERGADLESDLTWWAGVMLVFIGIGIVVYIIILIVFSIIVIQARKEEDDSTDVLDEMDRRIMLIATKNGFIVVNAGFIAALVTLVLDMPSAVMLNIVFLSFLTGSMVEGFWKLLLYRRGVGNG